MKQVEQMLREIEQNAQRKIAIINGVVILEEDRPKYEAILRLKAFVEDNQNIFRELNTLAGAAGVEVNSLVSGYAPKEEVHEEVREEAPEAVVAPRADSNDYLLHIEEPPVAAPKADEEAVEHGYLPDEVSMVGNAAVPSDEVVQVPEVPREAPAIDIPVASDGAQDKKNDDNLNLANSLALSDFLTVDNIDIALKYPENKVEVYHALNTWVATNIEVPMGYMCYARVNEVGNADVFLGKIDNFSWDEESDKALIEKARKDLVLYYDASLVENFAIFEAKHHITRVDQMSLPINIFKKKLYATVPYTPVVPGEAPVADNGPVQENIPVDLPAVDTPSQEASLPGTPGEVSLSNLLPEGDLTIEAKIPGNKYSVHDGLRKWLSENVVLPEGYALYVTVTDANEATIYLGKKSSDEPLALHELKTADLETWEHLNGITRVESKNCSLVVNSAIRDDSYVAPAPAADPFDINNAPDTSLQGSAGADPFDIDNAPDTRAPGMSQSSDYDLPDDEPEIEPETRGVVGRRLTGWASSFSKNQVVRRGINFLNKVVGRSPLYINYMDGLSAIDLDDPNAFDKLGIIVNNFERDKALFPDESEKEKIQNRIDRVVALAQERAGRGR